MEAISRKVTRLMPNLRIYPRGRPVNLQRLCKRTGDAFLGNLSNPTKTPAAIKAARFTAYFATVASRFLYLAFTDYLAIL